ncbi:MAG: Hsp20/alpha crystallin family protein [Patescibacteria group bacterium]|nr:Hsp20/alpha crystallin family protein [Patescibacteria group bacterium]
MTKKPSFFEKLTGASWEESEKKVSEKDKKSAKNELIIKEKINKMKKIKSKKDSSEKNDKQVSFQKKSEEKEDWLAESEGQLTIDVYQTPNEIVIKSTIAGVKPEDIDISMTNDMITIKGNRKKDEDAKEEDYYYQECYWGPFSRSVILPVDVEVDHAKAGMKNGILTIKLPKIERVKTKKISIEAE